MNNRNTTLAVAAIIAAAALTGVAFAIPQQAMAGGYGHRHHNNHNNGGIRVDQAVNQLNACGPQHRDPGMGDGSGGGGPQSNAPNSQGQGEGGDSGSSGDTTCLNIGANSAHVR